MKTLAIGVLLFLCALPAYSQGSRVQGPISTTASIGSLNVLIPVSNGTVNFCAYPAIGVPCVNLITTYTDATLGTTCSTSLQVVLDGSNVCVATTDSRGNWGVWVPAGNYTYTITSSAGNFGPFFVTAAAISGGVGSGVTSVGASSPLFSSGGTTPSISCPTCTNNPANLTAFGLVAGLSGFTSVQSLPLGTSTQVLHGNASGFPTWGAVNFATDGTGILPIANGGNGTSSPALVAGTNITLSGTWPNVTITSTNTASTAWSAITASTNNNAGSFLATGNTWDFSGVTLFKLRVGAAAVTTVNGDMAYDTTNKNWHMWSNAVDNINLLIPASVSVTNGDCAQLVKVGSTVTVTDAGSACSGALFSGLTSSTNTTAAMVVGTGASINAIGSGVINATNSPLVNGNPLIKRGTFIPALCNNATPSAAWDLPTSNAAVPACNTGTNVQEGVLQFADAQNAQIGFALPEDWTGAIDFKIFFFDASTSGTVIFNVATACTPVNGSATDDTAFNAADALGTVTLGGTANGLWVATKTGVNITGCAAGSSMRMKITRATDTGVGVAQVTKAQVTLRGTNLL